ncbi:Cro/Cl family transcriptional regulator [Ralstonia solanacearum]|nr:Cro/Cl family transcriptional regulator [Ralstonia solanacearum]
MKSSKYLDALIQKQGLKNDRALAAYLDVGTNTISQWRTGTRSMDHEMCLKLALALEMENPLPIIMAADMDRAERAGQHSLWEVFSMRMAHSGLVAILVALLASVTNFVTPSPAEAAPLSHSTGQRFVLC